jgi:YidC/Oxa1 family membrane protein insertase
LIPAAALAAGRLPLALDLDDAGLTKRLNEALYRVERTTSEGAETITVTFTWSDGAGLEARKALTFHTGSPLVDVAVAVEDRGRPVPARVVWGPGLEADDAVIGGGVAGGYIHYTGQAVVGLPGVLPQRTGRAKLDATLTFPANARARWAGLEEQYFAALIVPTGGAGDVVVRSEPITPIAQETGENPEPESQLSVAVGMPSGEAKIFVGAKNFRSLRALGLGLEDVVWFSDYGLIHFLAKWLLLGLLWIHDHVASNYGLAIVLATLALRIVLFPLNQYSMVRMRRTATQMQKVQPKLKAIQAKWKKSKDKDARTKMNEETMALYKREGVNPFGGVAGCLPMLAQFPILVAFYNVLTVAVELRGAPFFGWIVDLTQKDPFWVTPLLMGATMFIQQKMTPATGMDPAQQKVMMIMPIMFTVMFLNLPAGLVLYWLVNNVLGIGQQWLVNRHVARLDSAAAEKA